MPKPRLDRLGLRAATVARVAVALALNLPRSAPATRVLPAEVLWRAAQQRDVQATVQAWLDGSPLPAVAAQKELRRGPSRRP